jgi:hypothetical protein
VILKYSILVTLFINRDFVGKFCSEIMFFVYLIDFHIRRKTLGTGNAKIELPLIPSDEIITDICLLSDPKLLFYLKPSRH